MKTQKALSALLLCATLPMLALLSCDNDKEPDFTNKGQEKYVKFTGAIEGSQTRASGTSWGVGDAIGVYMKTAGGTLSADQLAGNVKHTTPGSGVFTAATTGIDLPATGTVDFIAYYPYQATPTGYSLAFSVANQSSLPDIDILYSDNAVNIGNTNATVGMNFKHKLSQLILDITSGGGITSLNGLTISVADIKVDGTLNLEDGTVTPGGNETTLQLTPSVSGTTASAHAILTPGQDLSTSKLTFVVGGRTFEWTPPSQLLESGKKYTYTVQLNLTGVVVLNPNGTIEDWIDGNPGGSSVVITPTEETQFVTNASTVTLAATATNETIQLTAPSTQSWTATAADSWLTVAPASGTGSSGITLTPTANPATTNRTTTVTITPTAPTTFAVITLTVTQAGSAATGSTELFPGSDFENWATFLASLNSYGLVSTGYAVQSTTGGRNGSSALHLNGTPTANDYVFTALAVNGTQASGTSIVFYIKGTAGKSLSMNVFSGDGVALGYYKFNLGSCTGDTNVASSVNNSYTGTINTSGTWAKVTLDISSIPLNTAPTDSYFALKVGKDAVYDLYIDDITIE